MNPTNIPPTPEQDPPLVEPQDIQHLDFPLTLKCQMFHVENDDDKREVARKCERTAAYIGYLHSCQDRYRKQGEETKGTAALFCEYYFRKCRDAEYEMTCRGCGAHFTNVLDRIWDFAPIFHEGEADEKTA